MDAEVILPESKFLILGVGWDKAENQMLLRVESYEAAKALINS